LGWADPVVAKSGNGYHLLYAVDLPNDNESTALVKGVLLALAAQFDDAQIKVDRSVFNSARICKLYGTVANKGDDTDSAPWRLSELVHTPARVLVTAEQLRTTAPEQPASSPAQRSAGSFSLEGFLAQHGMTYCAGMHDGRERFKLAECPFNAEHVNGEAAIFRDGAGKLGFHCMHDSCSGKNWQSLRDLLDGPRPNWKDATNSRAASSNFAGATGSNDAWPELQPLVAHTEAKDYPLDALPPLIRGAVMEVCGFVKAPVPLVAMSALAALSVAIQAHTDIQRAVKLEGPCGLFLCGIADSGERKTSCDGYFTKAIHDYQAREREKAKPLIQAYETDLDAWKAKRGGVQEKIKAMAKDGKPTNLLENQLHDLGRDKPKAPRVPRLLYSDATPEALASSLVNGWPSGGIFSNEGGIVLGGHAMNKDVAMRNMARLNSLWDGKIAATDRATTESYGDTVARLTMSLQVQEPTLRAFFDNTKGLARGTGFLARFLVAWPVSTMGTRFFESPPDGWPALAAFNNRLTAILDRTAPVDYDGILTPAMLTLAPAAKDAWVVFHDQIESTLATGGELYDLRDVGSKAADNVVRLAALFHVFAGSIGPVDFDCVESAVQIITWHLLEAKRFLGELAMPAELANPMRLETWLLDYCRREGTDRVSTREVQRNGPGGLRDKSIITEAVIELAELGRALLVTEGKRKLIQIRPELLVTAS
jgi:putative DNA primase/helicase